MSWFEVFELSEFPLMQSGMDTKGANLFWSYHAVSQNSADAGRPVLSLHRNRAPRMCEDLRICTVCLR